MLSKLVAGNKPRALLSLHCWVYVSKQEAL